MEIAQEQERKLKHVAFFQDFIGVATPRVRVGRRKELPGEDLGIGKGDGLLSIFHVHTNVNIGKYP